MLANEDTNSIPTDNANRAIQGNACNPTWWPTCETMLVAHDQIFNQSKLCHQVAKFATNASGAMLLPNLVQVTSISGSVVPLAMFFIILLEKFMRILSWRITGLYLQY